MEESSATNFDEVYSRMKAERPISLDFSEAPKKPEPTLDEAREDLAKSVSEIAHALFAKPLVVDTKSVIAIEVPQDGANGHLTADGRRAFDLSPGMRIEVKKSDNYVHLARLGNESFSQRLVKKFQLPVEGWRGTNKRK